MKIDVEFILKVLMSIGIGIITAIMNSKKGYSAITGFLWGALGGILGVIVVASKKPKDQVDTESRAQLKTGQWVLIFLVVGIGFLLVLRTDAILSRYYRIY